MFARLRQSRLLPLTLLAILVACGARLASQPQAAQQKSAADPHAAIRANNLGAAYLNQQKMEQALAEFERAYAADPKLAAARLNQGIALLNLQRLEPARAILREITERDAKSTRAWHNLGILEKNAGDADAALAAFEKAAALDPADADAHYFIGTLHAQLGRHAEAIAAFERAIALNKFHVSAEFGLARALQRAGQTEPSRLHLARFQHLTTEKLGAPMSLTYGDQGPYSLAESVTLPPAAAPPPIPVKFTPVPASESGLDFTYGDNGATACFLDYDNDGNTDLVLPGRSGDGGLALFRNVGGRFKEVSSEGKLNGVQRTVTCMVGDYDNDGLVDLAVGQVRGLRLYRNTRGVFEDTTDRAGLKGLIAAGQVNAILFVDFDHDGDLDILLSIGVVDTGKCLLLRNNGNGTFTEWTQPAGLTEREDIGYLATDFNNDRAVDLVFLGVRHGLPRVFLNPREGAFKPIDLFPEHGSDLMVGMTALDFDHDGWMDLALTRVTAGGLKVWKNMGGKKLASIPVPETVPDNGFAVLSLDYDLDGWVDLAICWSRGRDEGYGVKLFRNTGKGNLIDVTTEAGLENLRLEHPLGLAHADYDNDGDPDLLIAQSNGPVVLLRNDGGNKNNWLKLSLKGLADNKSAIGTKVEVYAGATYQKFEIQSSSGYLGQNAPDLLIGLGQEKQADVVRLLWPTGVVQDEVNLAANQRHVITQIDRRGSSCPVLFAWNGSRYEFITDAIGPGVVGHWVAPGVRNTSDPTEYIKVPGSLLRERIGAHGERLLSFRFAEPMEEIVYLDQLRLFAVDHPAGTDVNPSERFYASGPPYPTGEPVFTARAHARPPALARDHRGRDVTALLRDADRRYVTDFADAPYKGFTELHWIELDLGDAVGADLHVRPSSARPGAHTGAPLQDATQPLRLLLHGFTDYFTATSVYAAHQGGLMAVVPYVEALTPEGAWVRVVDDMGFPAGLARTMVADLTGKLPPGTRRIRIVTNLKVYWDQVLIDTTPAGTPHRVSEAPLASAAAGFLGYPREIRGAPAADIRYDYHTVSATGPYARAAGHYTRYGDVRALVAGADDRFVILGSGDEVAVEFDAAALPPVPDGWTRDWFFYVDGFAKDMDFYAAHPFTVTPLPYHAMPGYPYPAERPYPDSGKHLEDQLELNTRAVSGRAAPSYRFVYPAPK